MRIEDKSRFARRGLLSLAVTASLLYLLVGSAPAAITHNPEPFSPLTGSGSVLTLNEVNGVAIDEATGNVFVTDGGEGHERVAILGGEGASPLGLSSPYEIPDLPFVINNPSGLAYDNSPTSSAHGTLYAIYAGSRTIDRFALNPTTERYQSAGNISLPSGGGSNLVILSLDRNGDLYASIGANLQEPAVIDKFSPAGALLVQYVFPAQIGGKASPVSSPGQVAVDSAGDLFVAERASGLYKFPADESGEIDPDNYTQITGSAEKGLPTPTGVALDPSNEHIFVALRSTIVQAATVVVEYDVSGNRIDSFGSGTMGAPGQVAFDAETNRIYVADGSTFVGGHADVNVFGPAVIVPTTQVGPPTGVSGTKATLNGTVNAEGMPVSSCAFEWGPDVDGEADYTHTVPCTPPPPSDSEAHPVFAEVAGLKANGVTYHYRLIAANANGTEASNDEAATTLHTTVTEPATEVEPTTLTLNGLVRPEGEAYTACKFEWGLTATAGYEHQAQCSPAAAQIPVDFEPHQVSAQLTGLVENTTYKYRLVTAGGEALSGEELTVETAGRPVISEVRARAATQSTALIEAEIDPRGFDTSYRFEWGPTTTYGNTVPIGPEDIGANPTRVSASLTGLALGATYHYRVVASSEAGTTDTVDQTFETLNACGLPEGRCFELVSPSSAELGPAGAPGRYFGGYELHFQAAPTRSGALAYTIEGGIPGVTRGGSALYRGVRSETQWNSTQLSPAITSPAEKVGANSNSSSIFGLSPDLGCGVMATNQPLKPNTAASQLILESGGGNLYRINSGGSVTLLTDLAPQNPAAATAAFEGEYTLIGMASDCHKVIFASRYTYPGVEGVGKRRLYEWESGELRNLGVVPGSGGTEVPAEATGGSESVEGREANRLNAVSSDGSRVFFSALRVVPGHEGDSEEVGSKGLFARDGGTTTVDVSASETSTPDLGATFQGATADGGHVFFTANAGLTNPSNLAGTDLYEYTFNPIGGEPHLVDLSVSALGEEAEVTGTLGVSTDGSTVYFAAQGKLVPGKAATLAENQAANTYSLYGSRGGALTYVGSATARDLEVGLVLSVKGKGQTGQSQWSSRVSADGRYLLFRSQGRVTGFESGGVPEVYLYDANGGAEPTTCLSCRTDGHASFDPESLEMLASGTTSNPLYAPASLSVRNGQPIVVFRSADALAPEAREGEGNVYEWSHGQVFLLASQPVGASASASQPEVRFAGASEVGGDLYLFDAAPLNEENPEGRYAVWDARVGGGFAQPSGPAVPCDPRTEGACQGSAAGAAGTPAPATSAVGGEGNVKPNAHKKHKKHKKKSRDKKKGKKHKKKGKGRSRKQSAKTDREAGK